MLVKAQAAATAARRLKRKGDEEEEELAELAVKIIERADQVLYCVLNIIDSFGFSGGRQIGEIKSRRFIGRLVQWGYESWLRLYLFKMNNLYIYPEE